MHENSIAKELMKALIRLSNAALSREITQGDLCDYLQAVAELRAARKHADMVIFNYHTLAAYIKGRDNQ